MFAKACLSQYCTKVIFLFFLFSNWHVSNWELNLPPRYSLDLELSWEQNVTAERKAQLTNSSSADSASKASSLSSFSSNEKDRETKSYGNGDHAVAYIGHPSMQKYSRQISSSSAATSVSEYPNSDYYLDTADHSRSTSTTESLLEDSESVMLHDRQMGFRDRDLHDSMNYTKYFTDVVQRNSANNVGKLYVNYSDSKSTDCNPEKSKQLKKRDLIIPDEEEEFPFAKYTFNKKPDKSKPLMTSAKFANRIRSKNSIASKSLMDQYTLLHGMPGKRLTNSSSSSSLFSSMTSNSFTDYSSPEDLNLNDSYDFDLQRAHQASFSNSNVNIPLMNQMYVQNGTKMVPGFSPYPGAEFGAPISPTPMDCSPTSAEQILSSLGFAETQSFLPKRFLRSWVSKMMQSQQKEREILQQQIGRLQQPCYIYPEGFYDDVDIPPSVSAQHSGNNTPKWRQSLDNIHADHPPTTRPLIGHRKIFRRAHSFNPILKEYGNLSEANVADTDTEQEKEFGSVGALPLAKENSFDKLKRILQHTESHLPQEFKRNQFSSNRQTSLPLFLETLSEEDEVKSRSRSPSFEKTWDNKERRPSHMKHFFQEEERKSCTASEGSPENSRKNSWNEPRLSEVISNIKGSLDEIGDMASTSSNDTSIEEIIKNIPENRNQSLQLPSIIVSERDDLDNSPPKNVEIQPSFRPVSPHPDNQPKVKEEVFSKDSLEIAEIMTDSERRRSVQTYAPVLESIPSPNSDAYKTVSLKKTLGEAGNSTKFLKIGTDAEDKSLSPSSTNSPLGLSPVTVIEMAKLDNQNDSLETEDSLPKVTGSVHSVGRSSSRTLNTRCKCASPVNLKKHESTVKRNSPILDQIPKSLHLERRSYEREIKTDCEKDSLDGGDDNICVEYKEKEIQTTDNALPPVIRFSDISSVMQVFMRTCPFQGENLFYLAQDRGTQYKSPPVKINESTDFSNEESDRIDSGITSNQSSNESGSRLSPLQSLRLSDRHSNDKWETHLVVGSAGCHSNIQSTVKNDYEVHGEVNKAERPCRLIDLNDKRQDSLIKTVYRSEAFIITGNHNLNKTVPLMKQSNLACKEQTQTTYYPELIKTHTASAKYEHQANSGTDVQYNFNTASKKQLTQPGKCDCILSEYFEDNELGAAGLNINCNSKKNVTFSMTDSQEEKELKQINSFQRVEKNRTSFHDNKYYSFDTKGIQNSHESNGLGTNQFKSKHNENFLCHTKDETIKHSNETKLTGEKHVRSVLNFSFGNGGIYSQSDSENSMLSPTLEFKSDSKVYNLNETNNFNSLEHNLDSVSLKLECARESTPQKQHNSFEIANSKPDPNNSLKDMQNSDIKMTVRNSGSGFWKLKKSFSVNDSYDNYKCSGLTYTDNVSACGHYASRSLDFDTTGSRRAILKKCDGATFSKSFDTGSSMSSSFSSQEHATEDFTYFPKLETTGQDWLVKPITIDRVDACDSVVNNAENIAQEFLGIDLSEIDKYCAIADVEVLEDIDEECEELEKFIDSYSDLNHGCHNFMENSDMENKAVLDGTIKSSLENEKHDEEVSESHLPNSFGENCSTEGHVLVKEESCNGQEIYNSVSKNSVVNLSDGDSIIGSEKSRVDTERQTNSNVKIKTFQLGKNTINMRTFGNYSCSDNTVGKVSTAKIDITITDVDNIDDEKLNNIEITDTKVKENEINTQLKSTPEEEYMYVEESEKMKKIKELYKSFSFGDFEGFSFDDSLKETNDGPYHSYKNFKEKMDKNVTFEEVFAQNFEYLENENNVEDNIGHQSITENFTHRERITEEVSKASPHVNFVTHNCLNCGHKVTVAMHVDESYQKDHDYCAQCSPLDISIESLERKRQKKFKDSY